MFKSKKQEKNTFEFITRAGSSTLGKPKVFLAFHQDDKEVAFEIANDILSYANVAICYPTHNKVSRDEIEFVISMSSLLVLPITNKLLTEEKELFKLLFKHVERVNRTPQFHIIKCIASHC